MTTLLREHEQRLIAHSHRTLRIIRQNITASLGVKGVFVLLAIAADMGVSLAVVFNALRLLHSSQFRQ